MEVDETTTGNEGNRGLLFMVFTAIECSFVCGHDDGYERSRLRLSADGASFSFDWSMVSPDRDGLPDLADWHDDGGIQCVGLHPVLPKGLLEPVQGGGEFQRETSPPQDPHRDGEQRKVKHSRFNLFGEPAGHDPEACGSDRDGELWDEPDGGDVNHLLLEGEEEEGEEQEQEDVPQLENLTETAYTLHLWWRTH